MSPRHETLDPQIARDLADLEAALAAEPGADPLLTMLVSDVRAEAPRMSATFAQTLDARAAAGFPRAAGARGRPHPIMWMAGLRDRHRALLLPALGAVASVFVAVVVVVSLVGHETTGVSDQTVATQRKAAPAVAAGGTAAPESGAGSATFDAAPNHRLPIRPPVPTVKDLQSAPAPVLAPLARSKRPGFGRKVQKSIQLTLATSADDVQDVSDGVVRVTQGAGGFVASSQVTTNDQQGTATFSLRVPAKRLDETLKRLSALAHVASLTQSADDITGSFVSAASRLSDARAERRALLRALGKATTANAIASLRERLRFNSSEIAGYKGQLNALRRRADLATVEVTVEGHGHAKGTGGGAWTPDDAFRDALRVLEVAAGVLMIAAAALVPVALVGGLALLGARSTRRRRREEALDTA